MSQYEKEDGEFDERQFDLDEELGMAWRAQMPIAFEALLKLGANPSSVFRVLRYAGAEPNANHQELFQQLEKLIDLGADPYDAHSVANEEDKNFIAQIDATVERYKKKAKTKQDKATLAWAMMLQKFFRQPRIKEKLLGSAVDAQLAKKKRVLPEGKKKGPKTGI